MIVLTRTVFTKNKDTPGCRMEAAVRSEYVCSPAVLGGLHHPTRHTVFFMKAMYHVKTSYCYNVSLCITVILIVDQMVIYLLQPLYSTSVNTVSQNLPETNQRENLETHQALIVVLTDC